MRAGILLGAALGCAVFLPILPAQETGEMEAARERLAKLRVAVVEDAERTRDLHEEFLKASDEVKKGYLQYLESEFEVKRKQYFDLLHRAVAGGNGPAPATGGLPSVEKATLTEKRTLLASIRALSDEGKMKERLKKEGWDALDRLLVIASGRGINNEVPPEPVPEKSDEPNDPDQIAAKEVLEVALRVAELRREIRRSLFLFVKDESREQLGLPPLEPEDGEGGRSPRVFRTLTAEDRRVLAANLRHVSGISAGEARGVLQLNEWRIAMGLPALEIDVKLCAAARDHSSDMKKLGFFSHDSPVSGKETPRKRAAKFGTSARAENIATNRDSEACNRVWFFSPGHHKNMFGRFTHVGFGGSGNHWTQMFR